MRRLKLGVAVVQALRRSLARLRSERKALTTALKEREDRATPPKDR